MRFTNEGEPGTIILVTAHLGRYSEFETSLDSLVVPADTLMLRIKGGCSARSQNVGLQKRRGGWVWFIDDDHVFAPDVLLRLLARNKDIVAPIVPMRVPPYDLVLYKQLDVLQNYSTGEITGHVEKFYTMAELNGITGLLSVQGLPKAGCLVRESIWSKMKPPVFKIGLLHPDEIEDDKYFMWEVRDTLHYELWCDTDVVIGHMATMVVGCTRDEALCYHPQMFVT